MGMSEVWAVESLNPKAGDLLLDYRTTRGHCDPVSGLHTQPICPVVWPLTSKVQQARHALGGPLLLSEPGLQVLSYDICTTSVRGSRTHLIRSLHIM